MGGNDSGLANNGINISCKSGNWSYTNPSDIRYWPTTDTKLNFYAVNPGSNRFFSWKFSNSKKEISYVCFNEYQTSNFTIENGVNKPIHTNTDVMYAVAKDQTHETNKGKVKFKFKHILSQVVFKAKTQYDNDMEVDINAVSIHNFQIGGTFTIPEGEPAQSNWTLNGKNQPSGFTVKKVEEGKNIKVTLSDNAKDISDGPMLFVPQKLTKWAVPSTIAAANTAKQSYLKITCKIKQGGAFLFGSNTEYKDLYVPSLPSAFLIYAYTLKSVLVILPASIIVALVSAWLPTTWKPMALWVLVPIPSPTLANSLSEQPDRSTAAVQAVNKITFFITLILNTLKS